MYGGVHLTPLPPPLGCSRVEVQIKFILIKINFRKTHDVLLIGSERFLRNAVHLTDNKSFLVPAWSCCFCQCYYCPRSSTKCKRKLQPLLRYSKCWVAMRPVFSTKTVTFFSPTVFQYGYKFQKLHVKILSTHLAFLLFFSISHLFYMYLQHLLLNINKISAREEGKQNEKR